MVPCMDVHLWSTHDEVLLLCWGTMLICTRAEKQGGWCVSWPRSLAIAFAASSRAGHTCRHEMVRLCDMKPSDVERTMDAISNLHEWHHPTEKASPDTIDSGSTPTQQHHCTGRRRDNHGRYQQWLLWHTPTMPPHQGDEPGRHP
jgi:hypothetical protein